MEHFDIFVLAGQSNAVGRGLGTGRHPFSRNPLVMEYYDPYPMGMVKNSEGEDWLVMHEPPHFVLQDNAEEKNASGEPLASLIPTFVASYIADGQLAPGRKILIVKAAVDGTGFYWRHQWGRGERLSSRMLQVTKEALSLGDGVLKGVLWHQGEHEVFCRSEQGDSERKAFYARCLTEMIEDFRAQFGDVPWVCGEGTRRWQRDYPNQSKAVWDASREVIDAVGNAAFVSSESLLCNDEEIQNGDLLHFSRRSMEILGERYYEAWKALSNK